MSKPSTLHALSLTLLSCRKDPQGIFAEPVTDEIAPGYSALISNPMDFSTIAKKIDTLQYQSVDEYKVCYALYMYMGTCGSDKFYPSSQMKKHFVSFIQHLTVDLTKEIIPLLVDDCQV